MRQILLANDGVKIARMPVPSIEPNSVLVRVEYSMISAGTEVAGLRRPSADGPHSSIDSAREVAGVASRYLRGAVSDPRKAARWVGRLARKQFDRLIPEIPVQNLPDIPIGDLEWHQDNAEQFLFSDGKITISTDNSDWQYQAHTSVFDIPDGYQIAVDIQGCINSGKIAIGFLDADGSNWLGNRTILPGELNDRLIFDPKQASAAKLVISNAQGGISQATFNRIQVALIAPNINGEPHSEMDETGWNLGYSAAGTVVAVGQDVVGIKIGDHVACGGAGKANHSDYVLVPRNLVCPIPDGCDIHLAATTTIGTIAMQGVRRAAPELGERVCVIGLGLLGQITVQLLRAAGCFVIGMDLDERRVERAKSLGMDAGSSDPGTFIILVRDLTEGHGIDKTLITAATKSDAVINLSMEITRRRGTVVIVGDVGLNVQRTQFYRKEIDLLMSTSYGPGRYDVEYEEKGIDYPFAHVRWTLNRNMQSYMQLIASRKIDIQALIDLIIDLDEAPDVYQKIANSEDPPIGVLLKYSHDHHEVNLEDATRIKLRGSRTRHDGKVNYVLVGAGAYGQSMLVPMLDKHQDVFFLSGVVSRDAVRGGNFVRERRLELFSSSIEPVLNDPHVHMLVIATRHCDHAKQVIDGLQSGKHIFVEKPLAISWEELEEIVACHDAIEVPPLLMVGFNRRFSPSVQILRKNLENRSSPIVVTYRLNGGYIPLDHWIQNEQGAGRNIGEACHMYDVFRSLTGSPVASISANGINPKQKPYLQTDNFSATITYHDGSLCNLIYTALGPKKGLSKEYIEVFCDGDAWVIDDFKKLTHVGVDKVLWASSDADKGQQNQMGFLAEALKKGEAAPIPFDEIIETTAVSLHINDLLLGKVVEHA